MLTTEVLMSGKRYTEEFKAEAVKQVRERGYSTVEVALRLGVHKHSLYEWVRKAGAGKARAAGPAVGVSESAEVRRLKAELRRVTEERDILKKAAAYFAKG